MSAKAKLRGPDATKKRGEICRRGEMALRGPLEIYSVGGPEAHRKHALASCAGLRCEADAEAFARSRTAVPVLCDVVERDFAAELRRLADGSP